MMSALRNQRSSWGVAFLACVVLVAVVNLSFLGYIFANFESNIKPDAPSTAEARTVPVYLALFIFAEIYQILIAYDLLSHKNTILLIGIHIYTIALLAYASIQYIQIQNVVSILTARGFYTNNHWHIMSAFIIAIPCITGLELLVMMAISYPLYSEFGWSIYKHIGADLRLKRRYLVYLIYESLLKFDLFFFLGFTIQFVVIVLNKSDIEFGLTIAVIPLTIVFLYIALWVVKNEHTLGACAIIGVFFLGMAYFLFKLVRMYEPSQYQKYLATRKTLTGFAVMTLLLLFGTIINAVICTLNFNHGLRPVLHSRVAQKHSRSYQDHATFAFPRNEMNMNMDMNNMYRYSGHSEDLKPIMRMDIE